MTRAAGVKELHKLDPEDAHRLCKAIRAAEGGEDSASVLLEGFTVAAQGQQLVFTTQADACSRVAAASCILLKLPQAAAAAGQQRKLLDDSSPPPPPPDDSSPPPPPPKPPSPPPRPPPPPPRPPPRNGEAPAPPCPA